MPPRKHVNSPSIRAKTVGELQLQRIEQHGTKEVWAAIQAYRAALADDMDDRHTEAMRRALDTLLKPTDKDAPGTFRVDGYSNRLALLNEIQETALEPMPWLQQALPTAPTVATPAVKPPPLFKPLSAPDIMRPKVRPPEPAPTPRPAAPALNASIQRTVHKAAPVIEPDTKVSAPAAPSPITVGWKPAEPVKAKHAVEPTPVAPTPAAPMNTPAQDRLAMAHRNPEIATSLRTYRLTYTNAVARIREARRHTLRDITKACGSVERAEELLQTLEQELRQEEPLTFGVSAPPRAVKELPRSTSVGDRLADLFAADAALHQMAARYRIARDRLIPNNLSTIESDMHGRLQQLGITSERERIELLDVFKQAVDEFVTRRQALREARATARKSVAGGGAGR